MDTASAGYLFEQAARAVASGRGCALATVVGVQGSAYRHEGARMVVFDDGSTVGALSGGCLEADVAEAAREAIRTGRARLVRYDMTSDDDEVWGLGMGCNGVVEVLVVPLAPSRARPALEVRDEGNRDRSVPAPVAGQQPVGPQCAR